MSAPKVMLALCLLLGCLVGCRRADPDAEKFAATPMVPEGFDERQLEVLRCPENGSKLRFATRRELASINDRIASFKLKTWAGKPREDLVEAVLIRADGKIGYRLDKITPVMLIEEALVLNEKVGQPNPSQNRK